MRELADTVDEARSPKAHGKRHAIENTLLISSDQT